MKKSLTASLVAGVALLGLMSLLNIAVLPFVLSSSYVINSLVVTFYTFRHHCSYRLSCWERFVVGVFHAEATMEICSAWDGVLCLPLPRHKVLPDG